MFTFLLYDPSSTWIQEPSFSNSAGTIQFEGVVPNPGYSGTGGTILGVTFRAKGTGKATVSFSAGSILANDGEGTEMLSGKLGGVYSLLSPVLESPLDPEANTTPSNQAGSEPIPEELNETKVVPVVTSAIHPPGAWSRLTTGIFSFVVPESVMAMRFVVDSNATTQPATPAVSPLKTRELKDLKPGVSYLHVQYKTTAGWGEVTHYKLQIDTEDPKTFVVSEIAPGTFSLLATDALSGIVAYEIKIDGGENIITLDNGSHEYTVPPLLPGTHTLEAKALDAAGNASTITTKFAGAALGVTSVTGQSTPVSLFSISNLISSLLIAFLLFVIIVLLLLLGRSRLAERQLRRSLWDIKHKTETKVTSLKTASQQALLSMHDELELDIEILKKADTKRKLTKEEAKILKHLEQNNELTEISIKENWVK